MIWDILTKEEKNKILLKLLVNMTKADHQIKEGEFSYLIYICRQLNLSPELIKEYVNEDANFQEILPTDEQDRMNILYHLLFTMNSDDHVDPLEEVKIYQFAFKLGFSEQLTRDFITLMKSYAMDEIPTEGMLDIIRKHNN